MKINNILVLKKSLFFSRKVAKAKKTQRIDN